MMKRRTGKQLADIGVSRWLLQVRKDSPEEAPLVVPKVIRQYTRRKKETPAEPENKFVPTTTIAEQTTTGSIVDNEVKIKEEIPDIKTYDLTMNNHGKLTDAVVKTENLLENCSVNLMDYIKEENITTANSSVSDVSERVKMESLDETPNIYQKAVAGCHSNIILHKAEDSADWTVNSRSEYINKVETYNILDKINMEIRNNRGKLVSSTKNTLIPGADLMGQDAHENQSQCGGLFSETIIIKDESEERDSDCEIVEVTDDLAPVPCKVDKEPVFDKSYVETVNIGGLPQQVRLKKVNLVHSQMRPPGGNLRTYGRKKDTPCNVALKKCYLVAVNVEAGTSGTKQPSINPVALLPANTQQPVGPESLAGFKVVGKSQIFTCDVCSKHFLSQTGVRNHVRSVHTPAPPHVCHCGSRFTYNFMLLAHKRAHSGPLACTLCPKFFKTTLKYGYHLNSHLRERLYPCPVCMRRFTVLASLYQHASRHTIEDTFGCDACDSTFRCVTDLRRHSERDHGEQVDFPCYICNRVLASNDEFVAHVTTHDSTQITAHECAFCGKRLADYAKWEEHSKIHIDMITHTCAAMRPYVCGVCRKRFEFRSILKTHMSCHTGARPYKCKECSKTFKSRSAVSEHERGHSRPYPCPECPARFAKRDSLSRHSLLHSGLRPYLCPHCQLTFVQRSAMKLHVKRFHTPGLKRVPKKKGKKKNKAKPAVVDSGAD